MNKMSQSKEKYGIRSEIVSQDNFNEGTSARTRPYSYDEILLNRRNKELSEDFKVVANNKSGEHNVKNAVLDCFESDKNYRPGKDNLPPVKKMAEKDILKRSSRSEGVETREKKDRSVEERESPSHEIKTKVDDKLCEDKDGMVDRLGRGRRKYDDRPRDDSKKDFECTRSRMSLVKDESRDDSKNEFGRESKRKDRDHEVERNWSRNSLRKDRSRDDSKHGNDQDIKRKDQNQEDGNYRDRNIVKKHDFRKRTNPEYSDRKEIKDLSQSHGEKSRAKRRRSRSGDHEDKQNMAVLPKEYKHKSYHSREHEESVLDKKHSDVDKSTIPNYSLSNHEKSREERRLSRSQDNEDKQKVSVVPKEHKHTCYHSRELEESVLDKKHSDVDKSCIPSNSLSNRHDEKSRKKRRRSRSRDHEDKQKMTFLPKEHKHTSYHSREHEESVLDKKHSDVDKSTIPSNSLSNHRDEKSREKRRRSRSGDHENKQKLIFLPKEHKHTSYHSREHEESVLDKKHSDVDNSTIPSNGLSIHHDERLREKRRRSRSRDHEDKQKMIFLPKEHKHTFYHSREHEESVLDKKHSDVDKSTIPSSGLSNHHDERSRAKRRRSRSRDHEDKQKTSVLPKEHKHTSYPSRENEESVLDKKHSVVDKSTIPSNSLSNHHCRNGDSKSGLGGYSPRKRLTEVGAKTPPTARSLERKRVGWDLPPVGKENSFSESLLSKLQYADPTVLINMSILNSVTGVSGNTLSMRENTPFIDSVELTHATRPFRSLYVENLPASATEKEVIDYFNSSLLSSGVANIQEIQPCISCNIYKDRGQALVEFLTPVVATQAISLNDGSFSGSILKIRRPKDFVGVSTDIPEKSTAAVDAISDVVNDSPHKIFIGGISKFLSSEMILEIASVFGTLKAYHFKADENLDEPCAYLEYLDRLVTPKACAGLNGMKLGGKILIALLATPDASVSENNGNLPVYRTPEHAKPLLENPTEVLKLKNVFDLEGFSLLSELEIEEVLDDVRLECARFGIVKSLNLVRLNSSCLTIPETNLDTDLKGYSAQILNFDVINNNLVKLGEVADCETEKSNKMLIPGNVGEMRKDENPEDLKCVDVGFADDCVKEDKLCKTDQTDCQSTEDLDHLEGAKCELEFYDDHNNNNIIQQREADMVKLMAEKENFKLLEVLGKPHSDATRIDDIEEVCNVEQNFELGCVFVEFGRTEAACIAANCLHGRLFEDRVVSVQYIALDMYRNRFPK